MVFTFFDLRFNRARPLYVLVKFGTWLVAGQSLAGRTVMHVCEGVIFATFIRGARVDTEVEADEVAARISHLPVAI